MRAYWFLPYFMTAAFRISSSVFFHTPPWDESGKQRQRAGAAEEAYMQR